MKKSILAALTLLLLVACGKPTANLKPLPYEWKSPYPETSNGILKYQTIEEMGKVYLEEPYYTREQKRSDEGYVVERLNKDEEFYASSMLIMTFYPEEGVKYELKPITVYAVKNIYDEEPSLTISIPLDQGYNFKAVYQYILTLFVKEEYVPTYLDLYLQKEQISDTYRIHKYPIIWQLHIGKTSKRDLVLNETFQDFYYQDVFHAWMNPPSIDPITQLEVNKIIDFMETYSKVPREEFLYEFETHVYYFDETQEGRQSIRLNVIAYSDDSDMSMIVFIDEALLVVTVYNEESIKLETMKELGRDIAGMYGVDTNINVDETVKLNDRLTMHFTKNEYEYNFIIEGYDFKPVYVK